MFLQLKLATPQNLIPRSVTTTKTCPELSSMPMLTKLKMRSAHGIFSSSNQISPISEPTNFVKLSSMGGPIEIPESDSSNANKHQTKGVGEPLIDDLQQVHLARGVAPTIHLQEPSSAPQVKRSNRQPPGSHSLEPPLSDEEDTAPPPPDFTRRGIHVPLRTR
jgi:hypothetical protein